MLVSPAPARDVLGVAQRHDVSLRASTYSGEVLPIGGQRARARDVLFLFVAQLVSLLNPLFDGFGARPIEVHAP
jgi:hypothetical protein